MLQHSDGFDSHATGAATLSDGDTGWTSQSGVTIDANDGKFGGKSLQRAPAVAGYAAFSNTGTQKGFGFYVRFGTFGGAAAAQVLATSAAGDLVTIDDTGVVKVYDGAANLRITTAAAVYVAAQYPWIEVSYETAGITLRVGGAIVGTYTGAYTALGTTFRLGGASPANTPVTDFDDFITWDAAGSDFNTFGLGPQRIQLLQATADGDSVQWTPASGTNHAAVTDTDWSGGVGVTATAAGLKDLYELGDLAINPATIRAVVVKTKVVSTGDNPAQLAHAIRGEDDAEVQSSLQAVPGTAAVLKSVFYRDATNAPWTASVVNGLQAGIVSSNA